MIGLRRDGHLSDLGLEHVLLDCATPQVQHHLRRCTRCQHAARELGWAAPRRRVAPWVGAATALAAVVSLAVLVPRPTTRPKGGEVELELWRDAGDVSERLTDGDTVLPADRIGFRVRARTHGYVLVFGLDQAGDVWQYAPSHGDAMHHTGGPEPRDLGVAVELDDVLGTERFIAMHCDEPFALDGVLPALERPTASQDWVQPIRSDCAQHEVRLHKERP